MVYESARLVHIWKTSRFGYHHHNRSHSAGKRFVFLSRMAWIWEGNDATDTNISRNKSWGENSVVSHDSSLETNSKDAHVSSRSYLEIKFILGSLLWLPSLCKFQTESSLNIMVKGRTFSKSVCNVMHEATRAWMTFVYTANADLIFLWLQLVCSLFY